MAPRARARSVVRRADAARPTAGAGARPAIDGGLTADGAPGYCPLFQHVMELLGRRWTGVILRVLLGGETRFGDLRRAVPGLSDRLLAERLDELEREGLVVRRVELEHVRYALTPRGHDLRAVLDAVAEHTQRWSAECHPAEHPGRRQP